MFKFSEFSYRCCCHSNGFGIPGNLGRKEVESSWQSISKITHHTVPVHQNTGAQKGQERAAYNGNRITERQGLSKGTFAWHSARQCRDGIRQETRVHRHHKCGTISGVCASAKVRCFQGLHQSNKGRRDPGNSLQWWRHISGDDVRHDGGIQVRAHNPDHEVQGRNEGGTSHVLQSKQVKL